MSYSGLLLKCELKQAIASEHIGSAYQYLMWRHDSCETLAISYYQQGEKDLAKFYKNAAEGYKAKAVKCGISD